MSTLAPVISKFSLVLSFFQKYYSHSILLSPIPFDFFSPSHAPQFVKLKVNTNQYGRTFQDRSYVFTIKPLPTADVAASNKADTPVIDSTGMWNAIRSGGKIYNVNVRGKRGNIVQVYPSVEYDFVPNALALDTNDMVHFQWTGSDYNPRRGCNDAAGGPPDLNTYSTDANANENPRADRSNVVFTYHMGNNVPKNYLGYDIEANMTYAEQASTAMATVLENAPCYAPGVSDPSAAKPCYDAMMRLAYLNQQSDSGSLILRTSKPCLTSDQLDAILNQDVADYHPLNCAKLNAKPYSYFDGGVMIMKKSGWFPYFSSRNNNFSNRQQIGVICVGADCKVNNDTSVLQDENPMTNGVSQIASASKVSVCFDTANGEVGANSNGVTSCLPKTMTINSTAHILTTETSASQEGDNDNKGDGNKQGCAVMTYNLGGKNSVESNVGLALILLFVGLFFSWAAYYLYNRYQARQEGVSKFRYETAWQKASAPDKAGGRPASANFSEANPGIKMARSIKRADSASASKAIAAAGGAGAVGASVGGAAASGPPSPASPTPLLRGNSSPTRQPSPMRISSKAVPASRPASGAKVNKRYEMI